MLDQLSPEVALLMQSHSDEHSHLPLRWSLSMPEAREQTQLMCRRWNRDLPDMADVQDFSVQNRIGLFNRARLFVPHNAGDGLIVYFHGGGWVVGDIDTHEGTTRQLAALSGSPVLSCNYRLAPENPFPAGLEDCVDMWRSIVSGDINIGQYLSGPIAIAGDSSGANLALGVMLNELEQDKPVPDFAILFYAALSRSDSTESYSDFALGPGLTRNDMQQFWDWYLSDKTSFPTPLAEPFLAKDADLLRLPPAFFGAAAVDPLFSENKLFYERMRGLGRTDVWKKYVGVPHGFIQMSPELDLARTALEDATSAFKKFRSQ